MRPDHAPLIQRLRSARKPPEAAVLHRALMELKTAKEIIAEILDARPSEVDEILRERVAERFSILEEDILGEKI